MLQSKLIGDTKKEWPNEATLKSHGMLLKGGYIKQMASGIFTLMPLVATKKLWDGAGRYDAIGSELLRFKDRTGTDMVLSMTHEEAALVDMDKIYEYVENKMKGWEV